MGIETSLAMDDEKWLEVTDVSANSEAERIGIKKGDRLELYDGVNVGSNVHRFADMLTKTIGRNDVPIIIRRGGEKISLTATGGGLGIKLIALDRFSAPGRKGIEEEGAGDFMTLSAYGKFLSGFGWFTAILGIFAVLIGLFTRGLGIVGVMGGGFAIILGLGLVLNGQVVSCFVAIERNTKASAALLESITKQRK
jgi:hypothetical protein